MALSLSATGADLPREELYSYFRNKLNVTNHFQELRRAQGYDTTSYDRYWDSARTYIAYQDSADTMRACAFLDSILPHVFRPSSNLDTSRRSEHLPIFCKPRQTAAKAGSITMDAGESLNLGIFTSYGTVKSVVLAGDSVDGHPDNASVGGLWVKDVEYGIGPRLLWDTCTFADEDSAHFVMYSEGSNSLWVGADLSYYERSSNGRNYIQVDGTVWNEYGNDDTRALLVCYKIPLVLEDPVWGDDIRWARRIRFEGDFDTTAGGDTVGHNDIYENLMIYDDWQYSQNTRPTRYTSMYQLGVVYSASTGNGLVIAVPCDSIRSYRIDYNTLDTTMNIYFELATSNRTDKIGPDSTSFSFILYGIQRRQGFPEALDQYHTIFQDQYSVHDSLKNRIGLVGAMLKLNDKNSVDLDSADIDGLDFMVDVSSGDPSVTYGGVRQHMFLNAQTLFVRELNSPKLKCTTDQTVDSVINVDYIGNLDSIGVDEFSWYRFSRFHDYGEAVRRCRILDSLGGMHWHDGIDSHFVVNFDPDCDLVDSNAGRLLFSAVAAHDFRAMESFGVPFDGVNTDNVGDGYFVENFDSTHFNFIDFPLTYTYDSKRPVYPVLFSYYEWLDSLRTLLDEDGKTLSGNVMGFVDKYYAHLYDILFFENIKFRDRLPEFLLNYKRSFAGPKPLCQVSHGTPEYHLDSAAYLRWANRSLAYGMFAEFKDSGDDMNSALQHWVDEGCLDMYKTIPILLRSLGNAGWEPTPFAQICSLSVSSPWDTSSYQYDFFGDNLIIVNRFGEVESVMDTIYFTVHNESKTARTFDLKFNYDPDGNDPLGLGAVWGDSIAVDSLSFDFQNHQIVSNQISFSIDSSSKRITLKDLNLDSLGVAIIRIVCKAVAGENAESPVKPTLEFVEDNGDGTCTAHFGFLNENSYSVVIPIGTAPQNYFSPSPQDRGQPTVFPPGRHYDVFTVQFVGTSLVWNLAGRTQTSSCP